MSVSSSAPYTPRSRGPVTKPRCQPTTRVNGPSFSTRTLPPGGVTPRSWASYAVRSSSIRVSFTRTPYGPSQVNDRRSKPREHQGLHCLTRPPETRTGTDLCRYLPRRPAALRAAGRRHVRIHAVPSFLIHIPESADHQLPPETVDKRCSWRSTKPY